MTTRKKKSTRRKATPKRTYSRRRRRSSGLSGLLGVNSLSKVDIKNDLIEVAATAAGVFAAAKGNGLLDAQINKSGTTAMIPPAIITAVGVAGLAFMKNPMIKNVAKGVVIGGAFKLLEKALRKENILAGVEEDRQFMLPGIGEVGQAYLPENLPELAHYSENPDAPVTATGGDHSYHMGTPSEVLSGGELGSDDEIIAY